MTSKSASFEDQLNELQLIVSKLENGAIPLDEAMEQFTNGVKLSQSLEQKLTKAEATVAKLMDEEGNLKPLDVGESTDEK